ncbi:hypothetical protein [Zhongshania sp. BJYM1]|jgi:hypothetical protein|uniref:hypothetical protein n=1 Tax=Zhongshania aquatica TaxID=2965069 RepID=UPI0022B3A451|nr:hypothetical protein [Marortus sp. BJYM1]
MEQERIIRFWHAIELLQPQTAPKKKKRDGSYEAFIHDTPIKQPVLPWSSESRIAKQQIPRQYIWSHTLFAHLYDSRLVAQKLKEIFGADEGYREPQNRVSALFSTKFTTAGQFVEDSFVLSSEAWFLGRVLAGTDWSHGFENDQKDIGEHVNELLGGEVTGESLRELTYWIRQYLGLENFFGTPSESVFRFRSQPLKSSKPEPENDPLNSFLIEDLARIADGVRDGETSKPLEQYLSRHDALRRIHVDESSASMQLIDRLIPDAYPLSCWPSERHLGLVHSQQFAVNSVVDSLGNAEGLLGINGPPGTGKTTLLRDLIASVVSSRADELARLDRASDGFDRNGREVANDNGKTQTCFKFNPALYGFEIVVASANNGAVENITLELPQRDKVDESWLPEAEYFAELGGLTSGEPAWGLISGALGSKARRTRFVERYFYGQRPFVGDRSEGAQSEEADIESSECDNISENNSQCTATNSGSAFEHREDQRNEESVSGEEPKGFIGLLDAYAEVNANRSTELRKSLWQQAISDYKKAKTEAQNACADASKIRDLIKLLQQTRKQITEESKAISDLDEALGNAVKNLALAEDEIHAANMTLKHCLDALRQHRFHRPGFWTNLFSFWKAQRDWARVLTLRNDQRDLAKYEFDRITRQIKKLDDYHTVLARQSADSKCRRQQLRDKATVQTGETIDLASAYRADHLLEWLRGGSIGLGEDVELAEPWRIEGWRQARARVFIQALKLHQMFFQLEAKRIKYNLQLVNGMLTGTRYHGLSNDAIRSAWASLFMVVPVLSSTFASFAHSFGSLGRSDIGWLLVDEAGQASPQAAVGALWRARRALLVGDPLQIKPITAVSDAVLEHMRTHYCVDSHWLPNRQSAQTLADDATPMGRMVGPAGDKTWVGLPLVVHRRCDRPMYELSNRIAYDGSM